MSKLGFFELEQMEVYRADEKSEKKQSAFSGKPLKCIDCGLYEKCNHPKIKTQGEGRKRIMIVGEAPGNTEDKTGVPFVGTTGKMLRKTLKSIGIDPEKDTWITNAIRCRPPQNKTPTSLQVEACRRFLLKDIEHLKPNVVIAVGETAFLSLIGHKLTGRANVSSYSSWVGERIPDQEYGFWICPVYHPSFIARLVEEKKDPDNTAAVLLWMDSLRKAVALQEISVPDYSYLPETVELVTNHIQASNIIRTWSGETMFDYETTGLKPHRKGQKILCVSLSNGERTVAFPFFDCPNFRGAWRNFLTKNSIPKMAHNLNFESLWSQYVCKAEVRPWIDDTLLLAHCANNKKPTNEKFLIYAKLGIVGYDAMADQFIKPDKKEKDQYGANAFNRMADMPETEMLTYCALDSLYGRMLRDILIDELEDFQVDGYEFFVEGQAALSKVQQTGMSTNSAAFRDARLKVTRLIAEAKAQIDNSQEIKKWDRKEQFIPTKDAHIKHLLFKRLKREPVAFTDKGNISLDEKALEQIDIPFTQAILEYRRWNKALQYVGQFEREAEHDLLHSFLNLGIARTYRSSVTNPSLQNAPNRDEDVKKIIRGLVVPRQGNVLIGYDYKGIEVTVAAVRTGDRNLLRYVQDKTTDMHRDCAMDLFFMKKENVTKFWRYMGKNGFVFPEFYGDYWGSIGPTIWKVVLKHPEMRDHLGSHGIYTERQFTDHVKDVEDVFWNERFFEYSEWKKEQWAKYERDGYIDAPTGFRYWGLMGKNEIINYQIQGPAFHILLWSLIQISKRLERDKELRRSFIVQEIHDQLLFDAHPDDEEAIDNLVWKWGTQRVRGYWPWISIPLEIEKDRGDVDAPWSELKSAGYLAQTTR